MGNPTYTQCKNCLCVWPNADDNCPNCGVRLKGYNMTDREFYNNLIKLNGSCSDMENRPDCNNVSCPIRREFNKCGNSEELLKLAKQWLIDNTKGAEMTSKLDRIKRMERDLAELKKQVANENCGIDCPVEMTVSMGSQTIGIVFQAGKTELNMNKNKDFYEVEERSEEVKTKLHKINRDAIKKGDVVFRSDIENPDFTDKDGYCLCLKDRAVEYYNISNDESVFVGCSNFNYYWIVKESKEC